MTKRKIDATGQLPMEDAPARVNRHALLSTSALAGGAMRGFVIATGVAGAASLFVNPAMATDFTAGGANAPGTRGNSVGIGTGASGTGTNSVYIGAHSNANGTSATSIGPASNANGANATAVGVFSNANGDSATATGHRSFANG